MLETLYDIDWTQFPYHVGCEPKKIPEAIWNLVAEDGKIREAAKDALVGIQQDTGDLYPATPYIVPFIVELLASEQTPDRNHLLDMLACWAAKARQVIKRHSAEEIHLNEKTYDVIAERIDIYTRLTTDSDHAIRREAIHLMRVLSDAE
jgi:hypothetical protein